MQHPCHERTCLRQQRARSGKNKVEEIRSSRRAGWGRLCYKRGCVSSHLWSPLCMVGSWPYYLLHLLVLFAITGHKKASLEAHRIGFSAFFVLSLSFLDLYSQPERGIIFLLIIIFFLSFGSAGNIPPTNSRKLWFCITFFSSDCQRLRRAMGADVGITASRANVCKSFCRTTGFQVGSGDTLSMVRPTTRL